MSEYLIAMLKGILFMGVCCVLIAAITSVGITVTQAVLAFIIIFFLCPFIGAAL